MRLLLLEALGVLLLAILIVWWTMFSGRNKGELIPPPAATPDQAPKVLDASITNQVSQLDR